MVLSDKNDLKLLRDVCELTDRYQVLRLFDKIEDNLKTIDMNFVNLEPICGIAFDFKINELIGKVKHFLEKNLSTIIVNKDIKQFKQIDD